MSIEMMPTFRFTLTRRGRRLDPDWIVYEAMALMDAYGGDVIPEQGRPDKGGTISLPGYGLSGSYRFARIYPNLEVLEVTGQGPGNTRVSQISGVVGNALNDMARDAASMDSELGPSGYADELSRRQRYVAEMAVPVSALGRVLGPVTRRISLPGPEILALGLVTAAAWWVSRR